MNTTPQNTDYIQESLPTKPQPSDGEWIDRDDVTYSSDYRKLIKGNKELCEYKIPDGTEEICDNAFENCTKLTSIFPFDSVMSIGVGAFKGCTNLQSIKLNMSVTTIGDEAFKGCTNLQSIVIIGLITSIGNSVFENCKNLKSITLPDGVTTIGNRAFYGCENLSYLSIPVSITKVGSCAFSRCSCVQPYNQIKIRTENAEEIKRIQALIPIFRTFTTQ